MKHPFDHVVMGAASLAQGVQYLESTLGITIPYGGIHPKMGTHNCLLKLSDSSFFELIAIDPEATPPSRPRWFGLDNALVQAQLSQRPRLLGYVMRSDDLTASLRACASLPLGEAVGQTRGALAWDISIPAGGELAAGGTLPMLIAWHGQGHPAASMPDAGVRLERLILRTPYPQWSQHWLAPLQLAEPRLTFAPAAQLGLRLELRSGGKVIALD